MRFVILHYHIFKNAGSTIEDILDHSFGERFGNLESPVDGGSISSRELIRFLESELGLRAFSSHQIRYPLPQAPGFLFFDICFLRDPLDRLRSFYDYFRQRPNPADPMSGLANSCGLGDFAAGMLRDHSLFIRNNQVNLLACGGDSDEPGERDLELAIRRAMASSFLGVVDCFDESAVAGTAALRAAFPELDCARPAVNVSRGMQGTVASRIAELREACRPEVYEELLRITALDQRLVDRARVEVLRRFEQVRPPTARPLAPRGPVARQEHCGAWKRARRFVSLTPYWRELAGSARATLFDADCYRASGPEGGGLLDFLLNGAYQGRKPHPLFDPAFYLRKYPDVAATGLNPFCHYLKHGYKELRQPHPLFDPVFYLDQNPDVRREGLNPLLHYLRNGAAEDRKPHPLFEPKYYRANCAATLAFGENPLIHFVESGAEAASPHPLFDCEAYLVAHPDVAEQGLNPLVHYPDSAGARGVEVASGIRLNIQDVQLAVSCLDTMPDSCGEVQSRAVLVWQDDQGLTHWIAEPQQLPFLRAICIDQIRVQANPAPRA